MNAEALAQNIHDTLHAHLRESDRSKQSAANVIGISDIGTCRERLRHMIVGTERDGSEADRPMYAPMWGHAIEEYVVPILTGPIVEHVEREDGVEYDVTEKGQIVNIKVTVTLPSGKRVSGSPDLVLAQQNTLLDVKTVDGLTWVKREGASQQQRYQRRLYTAALIQMGLLDDSKPVYCGNVWFDRAARAAEPHVEIEEYNEAMLVEIDDYLGDVDYAVLNGETASLDMPFEWCEKACPFFMSCRGKTGLVGEGGWIDDPDGSVDKAAAMYAEGAALEKEGKALKNEAKPRLEGVSGRTDNYTVTSTWIDPSDVPGYTRAGYTRMTIRKAK